MGNERRQTFDKGVSSNSLCLQTDGFSTVKTLCTCKARNHNKGLLCALQLFKFYILSPTKHESVSIPLAECRNEIRLTL